MTTIMPCACPLCGKPMLKSARLTEQKPFMFVCADCGAVPLSIEAALRVGFIHGWEACRGAGYSAIGDIPKPEKCFEQMKAANSKMRGQ